ncbi:MAG: type III pantothenate kinase [Thermomonas sp.]|uniref:type III pantothenate kinase n=1 Tax=Thermomonas sp. TaxID=1971895 RepID=UPI001EC9E1A0|nr:type III pantothenate kinase [Thermomonas sp.]MBV2208486.1 type III pantothenate kinase [Thermomonas sp.]
MTTWLFDLGNTRLKCAPLLDGERLGAVQAMAHDNAEAWLRVLPEGEVACVASVASEARRVALFDALSARFQRVHRVRTECTLGALQIAYANPEHLGVDRFLAMLGACGQGATLWVGVGTALTIDLVDISGMHRGGRIAPSPQLMRESLHQRAAQLPETGGCYAEFADDTDHALASGCEGAALALIERSLQAATALLGSTPQLVLHGGGAESLRPHLAEHRWVPDAVLHGLVHWHALRMA